MDSLIVLCIDDRPQVLELRKAVLASHNFAVETALNGYTAIKMLEGKSADAVLLEYRQEGMDAEAIAYQIEQRFGSTATLRDSMPDGGPQFRSAGIFVRLAGGGK